MRRMRLGILGACRLGNAESKRQASERRPKKIDRWGGAAAFAAFQVPIHKDPPQQRKNGTIATITSAVTAR